MKRIVELQNRMMEKEAERLNGLAFLVRGRKTSVMYRGGRFYLVARLHDQRSPIASFSDPAELKKTLLLLTHAGLLPADEVLQERIRLWQEQNAFAEERKVLVYEAHLLDFPDTVFEQQAVMEKAWDIRKRERLCEKARCWLDLYGIPPGLAGITDFERHDPDAANEDDPVPAVDCDWFSGELRVHHVRNFPSVYARASLWPDQNYVAELRRFHTDNIRNAWDRVVNIQLLPLMEKIKKEGYNKKPGRELIREVKARIAPWSISQPWPAVSVERKYKTERDPVKYRRRKSAMTHAAEV